MRIHLTLLALGVAAATALMLWFPYPGAQLQPTAQPEALPALEVLAEGLEIPWDLVFLPGSEGFLITERPGRLVHIDGNGNRQSFPIEGVLHRGEGGLLGMALHPSFEENRFLYLYFTTEHDNRVEQFRFEGGTLSRERTIIENLPASNNHNGGRIAFGPDGMLYITTGDAGNAANAQQSTSLAGKILRLHEDGSVPADNPFGNAVYSTGHRNPQGLAWDSAGRLWSTEHGRSGARSGLDELNLILPGRNYGWPESEGDRVAEDTIGPVLHSGERDTWAPAGATIIGERLFFGGLRGAALYEVELTGENATNLTEHFKNQFGRIRAVGVGRDGMLYFTTSNRDGRGEAHEGDDKLLRANPATL